MDSNSTLKAELKRLTRELASHKIELHQTRGYLHSILQNSTDMIFATEVTGIVISFSKGAEKALGYSVEEVIGRSIEELAEDQEGFNHVMATCEEQGCAMAPDIYFRDKEGKRVHCHASLMTLTNRDGHRVGTIGVCRDITQWKKLQNDLVQVDRLAEMGRIAAGVAHELNNPMAVISEASGWAGMVIKDAKGLSPEDRQELEDVIKKISAQTRRCRNVTHKLLDFVRDSAPSKTEFDIHTLIKETIDFLKPELKHTPIKIHLNFAEEPLSVNSDPKLLEQVFVNFITNAIHAVLEKQGNQGRIEIGTTKTDSQVEIRITDNGGGIPKETREEIFDLFYTTKPPGKGTGLGLPICRNIVGNLGGKITLDSEVGVGTTFTIQIPIS
jgi:PAS domain S-box-containing protein